jgi:hypothetical protein
VRVRLALIALAALLLATGSSPRVVAEDEDRVSATAAVPGPVTFRLETVSADVEVRTSSRNQVSITIDDAPVRSVTLVRRGQDRMEASFGGRSRLTSGEVRLELPRGSHLDLATVSGDARVAGIGGEVRFRTMSGEVDISGASSAEVRTISGDVIVRGTPGPARIKTVSGDVTVGPVPGPAAQLDFETTSGDLRWVGRCGARCRLAAQTVSGDLDFELDRASSVEVKFQSHSGDVEDQLGIGAGKRDDDESEHHGLDVRGRYGRAEGVIECRTYSGDLRLSKR